MDINKNFAEYLKNWIEENFGTEHGSIKKAADFIGVTPGHLSNILSSRRNTKEELRRAFAKKIGVPYDRVVGQEQIESGSPQIVDFQHCQIISKFKNKPWARKQNMGLLVIEKDPDTMDLVDKLIDGFVVQVQTKLKKIKRR